MAGIRSFVAVNLSADVRVALAKLQQQLKTAGREIRWVRPESIHLTLKFLGEVPQSDLPHITAALQQVSARCRIFSMSLADLGGFPNLRNPRVIWVGIQCPDNALADLAQKVDEAMVEVGFPGEERAFKPHLTLARVKSRPDTGFLDSVSRTSFHSGSVAVSEFALMRSELTPHGAVYTSLAQFKLT